MTQPIASAVVTVTKTDKTIITQSVTNGVPRGSIETATIYDVVTVTNPLSVTQPNTLVTFTLSSETAASITIVGADVSEGSDQIIDVTVQPGGRSITMTDLCTVAETIHIFLQFSDSEGRGVNGFTFEHDPEIDNVPH